MTPEQRRAIYTEALTELGAVMDVLRNTGWNPFAEDAPAQCSYEEDGPRINTFFDVETGLEVEGTYYYDPHHGNGKDEIEGEYRFMDLSEGRSRVGGVWDIRSTDGGGRVQYIEFDAQTAVFAHSEIASETVRVKDSKERNLAIGVEKFSDGTSDIFIHFMHSFQDSSHILETPYIIALESYRNRDFRDDSIFAEEGVQEMISGLETIIPEMFLPLERETESKRRSPFGDGISISLRKVSPLTNTGLRRTYTNEDLPEYEVEEGPETEEGILEFIRFCSACGRPQDVAQDIVDLVGDGIITNPDTEEDEDTLRRKIERGWYVVYERDGIVSLLEFRLTQDIRDKVLEKLGSEDEIFQKNTHKASGNRLVENLSRGRIDARQGYPVVDNRIELDKVINPVQIYDLLRRGYISFINIEDRLRNSIGPLDGMSQEEIAIRVAECIEFGLKMRTLEVQLVSGMMGPEYEVVSNFGEEDEDIEVIEQHFRRIELMDSLRRPQDYGGSMRAMVEAEAGDIFNQTDIPDGEIEGALASGEAQYFSTEQTIRFTPRFDMSMVQQVRTDDPLLHEGEVQMHYVRGRIRATESPYLDEMEDFPAQLDLNRLEELMGKGYINVSKVTELFTKEDGLFAIEDPDEFRAEVARIIREGINGSEMIALRTESEFGPEYTVIMHDDQDAFVQGYQPSSPRGTVPLPTLPPGVVISNPFVPGVSPAAGNLPRPEREGVNASERELPVMTASELEEAFDIPVAELENRLNTVLTTDMVRRLKAAGMWNSSGLQEVAIRPGIVLNMISSWDPKKGLFLNTALIISEEEEAMIGVLTDINPEEGTTVPTMVVDYRVVGPQDGKGGGKTRLVLTCLKKDVLTNQGRISLPTVEEGGYVFVLEFDDPSGVDEPEIPFKALGALDLGRDLSPHGIQITRYNLSKKDNE